jgi:excisionase family DNA binding protein
MSTMASPPISVLDTLDFRLWSLGRLIQQGGAKLVASDGRQADIPEPVQDLLILILEKMRAGKAVSIVSEEDHALTTQQAADLLGVSRPFLIRLVENREIPFHRVGSHRRIYLRDVLNYKRGRDTARLVIPG